MIAIIGAGPVGCFAAKLLAQKGHDVTIYEEYSIVGKPVQCTGIVTSSLKKILSMKNSFINNTINTISIYAPHSGPVDIRLHEKNIILDRHKFDSSLAEEAKLNGAKICLRCKFVGLKKDKQNRYNLSIKDIKRNRLLSVTADHLIGADGPLSQVAKSAGMYKIPGKDRKFLYGYQIRAKLDCDNKVAVYPHIGSFSWIVPEGNGVARIGVLSDQNPKREFGALAIQIARQYSQKLKAIDRQGGLVPLYNNSVCTEKDKVYLVGDAAMQVKATTGGGLYHGLYAARLLAESIDKGNSYEKEWHKKMGRDLITHLYMYKILKKFKDNDWDRLVDYFSQDRLKRILGQTDREYAFAIGIRLLAAEPRLLTLLKYLI